MENDAAIQFVYRVVRPLIEADGGSVEVLDISKDEVTVRLGKACVGCPGVHYTKEFVLRIALEKALGRAITLRVVWENPAVPTLLSASPPSTETFAKDPEAPYGIAKLSVEYYLAYYGRVHGLDTVSLRYGNVYGPRQDPHGEAGVVAIFCNRILDGRALTVFGDGEQTRDYVYAGDVAAANFAAATGTLPAPGRLDARAFNIGTSIETSVNTLATTLQSVAAATAAIDYAPARAGELARSALQTDKARTVLGWTPTVSLADGLTNTFRYFAGRRTGAVTR